MANEIVHGYDSGKILYAFVYRISDKYIYDVGDGVFEVIGAWNDARADECDITMTSTGDVHFGTFPIVAAGVYYVEIRDRAGANPDTDDKPVGQGIMHWDGTAEINITTLDTSIDDDIIGADGDTLESLSDQLDTITTDLNIVHNIYDET